MTMHTADWVLIVERADKVYQQNAPNIGETKPAPQRTNYITD